MQNVSVFRCSALVAAACVALGCGGNRPGDSSEIVIVPTTLPTSRPTEAAEVIVIPAEPVIAPDAERKASPATVPFSTAPSVIEREALPPTITPAAATAPATLPSTAPALRPGDVAAAFERGLAGIARGEKGQETVAIEGLSSQEQRTLAAILHSIGDFDKQLATRTTRDAVIVLLDMADHIRTVAPLHIPRIAISTKVEGFGVYDAIEPRFLAGRGFSAAVYCELTGFSSRVGDRAMWETRLIKEIKLVNIEGAIVWHDSPSTIVDVCRNRRRDFYVGRVIRLPATLPAGKYVLTTSITDQFSREVAEGATDIELVAGEQP